MAQTDIPRIAVLVDTSTGWGRRLIRGIQSFVDKHGPWDLWLEPHGQEEQLRLPAGWQGDGVIARVSSASMADHLQQSGLPVINVSAIRVGTATFPRVMTNESDLAKITVTHFLDRGIRRLGYIGLPNRSYSLDRQKAIQKQCQASGLQFFSYAARAGKSRRNGWAQHVASVGEWLESLPKPLGVFTWGVRDGLDAIRAAKATGLFVPNDVAVLCGDDDELLCESARPALSGVIIPSEQLGHEAAHLLSLALEGADNLITEQMISPAGVNERASSDVLAIEDAEVARAVRFIRDHAGEQIRVADVVEAAVTTRRHLERRFQIEFSRTIGEEISRAHLERAKRLLVQSDMPIPKVADASGYGSPEYFSSVFRRHTGQTPLQYRIQAQGR